MSPSRRDVLVRRLRDEREADECARLMASSEPWLTLQRSYEAALGLMRDATREVYVADAAGQVVAFVVLTLQGPFSGYVQSLYVRPEHRGLGLGTALMDFAERRIFEESPNVFVCASSFNPSAQRLYRRLDYEVIGELRDFIVPGHSEILLWKSKGPLVVYRRANCGDERGSQWGTRTTP
jgi:ribosomal protein S18 acetylase RimI-like enzyme